MKKVCKSHLSNELEQLIHKLLMNLHELAPDDDGAGEMEKSKVIGSLFLKADQQFAEAVEKKSG